MKLNGWRMNGVCLWSDDGIVIPNVGIELGNYLIKLHTEELLRVEREIERKRKQREYDESYKSFLANVSDRIDQINQITALVTKKSNALIGLDSSGRPFKALPNVTM